MRIGIDARLYGTKHGGIGRYTQELIKNLEINDQINDYFIFLTADNFDDYQPQNPKFKKVRADFKVYGIFEQLLFPILLYKYNLKLVHFTHFNVPFLYAKKFIVTIHDLIISHYPSSRATTLNPIVYQIKLFFYNWIVSSTTRHSHKIIAVSQFTKKDIVKFLQIRPEKISVVYEGVDLPAISNADQAETDQLLDKLKIGSKFILYVGSAYPHKNLEKLIEAFSLIKPDLADYKLVLAGRNNFFYNRLKDWANEHQLADQVVFTDYLSDQELANLYQQAQAYVFPSLLEGFGLPPLEAQYYNLPVISSKASCLPEVLGESAVYFDPEDAKEMAEKIKSVLNNEDLRQKLILAGQENLKKYSWSKMAKEILELYK